MKFYSPTPSLTGPIAVKKFATCSISESVNLFERVLKGFYSVLSESRISLSIGILYAFNAANCYSLWGYPTKIYPLISFNLPLWFIIGIIYFKAKSSSGGVLGLYY